MQEVKIFNNGFVKLIDSLGNDLRVINCARQSFDVNHEVLTLSDDKLIKYLAREKHWAPFRHVMFTLQCQLPEIVTRQLYKHQVGIAYCEERQIDMPMSEMCVHEHTPIVLIHNGKRKNVATKYSIKSLYEWQERGLKRKSKLRVFDVANNTFIQTLDYKVIKTGMKELFNITLSNGKQLKCTKDHKFLTQEGWKSLEDLVELKITNNTIAFKKDCVILTNGKKYTGTGEYKNYNWLKTCRDSKKNITEISNLCGASYHTIRKWLKIHDLKFTKEETYYKKGSIPWNTGLTYKIKNKVPLSKTHLESIRKARSGKNCNFWKGGITPERTNIGRWTSKQAKNVHNKFNYTCQKCCIPNSKLNAHHIIPVWMDISKAYEFDNLITLCETCHKHIHSNNLELEFAESLKGKEIEIYRKIVKPKSKFGHHKEQIINIEVVGYGETYDIQVDNEHHNYIANNIIVHNSGRYVEADKLGYWIPDELRVQSKDNKQGSEPDVTSVIPQSLIEEMIEHNEKSIVLYHKLLDNHVCKEQARSILTTSFNTKFTFTLSLQALVNFIKLRLHKHAQKEIQLVAQVLYDLCYSTCPISFDALLNTSCQT